MATSTLEKNLNDIFTKKLPPLPDGAKRVLVEWAPWLSLIGGVLTLWSAWALWHWAHVANAFVNYANDLSAAYGGTTVATSRLTLGIWLGVAFLAIEGALYLLAFSGLRDRKKRGWDLLYYGAIINVIYGVVVMFTNYGDVGSLIGSLIGSAIGLYLLFQVRSRYGGASAPARSSTAAEER